VRFSGKAAAYTVSSNTQLVVAVPVGATTGPISVTTLGGTESSTSFTVLPGALPVRLAPGAVLSRASALAARQTVELVFADQLVFGGAGGPAQYAVTVNGAAVTADSVAQPNATTVELGLPEGSFKAGDALEVSWSNLRGGNGASVSGKVGPVTAR